LIIFALLRFRICLPALRESRKGRYISSVVAVVVCRRLAVAAGLYINRGMMLRRPWHVHHNHLHTKLLCFFRIVRTSLPGTSMCGATITEESATFAECGHNCHTALQAPRRRPNLLDFRVPPPARLLNRLAGCKHSFTPSQNVSSRFASRLLTRCRGRLRYQSTLRSSSVPHGLAQTWRLSLCRSPAWRCPR
jgi:hypothetical protein